ncbi:TPA: hypothetical protein N3A35_004461 [Salmonella enterica subsp. salamae serovar 16:m,t:e,n,x]|uniref:Uncharacterized protein n=1 Tax=Salmonella enterica TaxID=28901 RepID=A0A402XLJ2_SALER|nr:hypothetical protein [Salmonella enterica]HCM1923689.1 hypothetical protein [Salmonella enterica subsp. salamae serovar 16:m,t:e,n,x]HCM1974238.1 hypothetical protein [Salmonella enterica subsp. salamae serovar 52:z:z39]EAQ6500133.1 hypothetical protein [Salmonella enterica]EAY9565657.1 hypothetical protein [Salmonella enterica]EBQ2951223.1 hypothetical protein [Salmonella enterica]
MKLIVELHGIDPVKGEWFTISKHESDQYDHDFLLLIINKALDEGAKYSGNGLEGLRAFHVELSVAIIADEDGCRPAFDIDARTISRLSAAGASFDFDPYV